MYVCIHGTPIEMCIRRNFGPKTHEVTTVQMVVNVNVFFCKY